MLKPVDINFNRYNLDFNK